MNPADAPASRTSLRIFECRWSWCRAVFQSNQERIKHLRKHASEAIPVRKGDIQLLRLAEDGVGESMRLYELECSQKSTPATKDSIAQSPFLSRLSRSVSPGLSPYPHVQTKRGVSPRHTSPPSETHPTPKILRSRTPTFGSLSSPVHEHPFSPIPESPSFDALVQDATRARSKPWRPLSPFTRARTSNSARSSASSINSVVNHLTQSPSHSDEKPAVVATGTAEASMSPSNPATPDHPARRYPARSGEFTPTVRQSHCRQPSGESSITSSPISPRSPLPGEVQCRSPGPTSRLSPDHFSEAKLASKDDLLEDAYSQWTDHQAYEESDPMALIQSQAPFYSQSQVSI